MASRGNGTPRAAVYTPRVGTPVRVGGTPRLGDPRLGTPRLGTAARVGTPRLGTPRLPGIGHPRKDEAGAEPERAKLGSPAPKDAWAEPNPAQPQTPDPARLKTPSVAGGPSLPPRSPPATADDRGASPELTLAEIAAMTRLNGQRNKVAFLLGRAPANTQPSPRLSELEATMPESLRKITSTQRTVHGLDHLEGADPLQRLHLRKRDRMTDFTEVMMKQTHITRK